MARDIILSMKSVTKIFPGVKALDDVTFEVDRGEIHALVGENGAGKSTLIKILDGLYIPDAGTIEIEGETVKFDNPRDAFAKGIHVVHQEVSTVDAISVAENIFMGRLPRKKNRLIDRQKLYAMTAENLKRIGSRLDPRQLVEKLSVAEKQMMEIVKAVSFSPKLLIMDEPTSSLSKKEIEALFFILRGLNAEGVTIIYISHKLEEIFELCGGITILRDGKAVHSGKVSELTKDRTIEYMVGRSVENEFPARSDTVVPEEMFRVENLRLNKDDPPLRFHVNKGEILGFAGVVGAGRTEIMSAVFGITRGESGEFFMKNRKVQINTTTDAIESGIAMLTESRRESLVAKSTVAQNITMVNLREISTGSGFLRLKKEKEVANRYVDILSIRTPSLNQYVLNLSGGNQQKVIIAKWLFNGPDLLILDEPTRGIDVGAKREIYQLMDSLAKEGKSIIFISSELGELLAMSDRLIVMKNGGIAGELRRSDFSPEVVMSLAVS